MEKAHSPFSVSIETLDHWEKRNRRNNFFELVYIIEGKGAQCVNYNHISYREGSIFLLPASDCHTYTITEETTFLFIRFTATYFSSDEDCVIDFGKWFCRLNFIIGNYNRLPGELISDAVDKQHLVQLLQLLMVETKRNDPHTRRIMQSTMVTVLELIARNVAAVISPQAMYEEKKFADMLLHIHYHLLDEEMISPQYLAERFHISATYFSEYFKRNANETYQEFVLRSKLKLAEAKALYTDIPFKEIAYDLGFTDSSHLNKMMKRFYNKGMSAIRKSAIAAPLV
ncbi:AraC family transcriptional regulator [Chitinophaga varians]|uniref:AraC family transcriptional regulator n=1 Tax=Chitinophaga varians TaxID=2202339 RepID=UPI00165ED1CE|nr:helix-turn-helix transcriptional regulator [Chitinophaga varians]MBC9911553.1 helix-turn-helix domain-containing protein [Chitinophaga varians]